MFSAEKKKRQVDMCESPYWTALSRHPLCLPQKDYSKRLACAAAFASGKMQLL